MKNNYKVRTNLQNDYNVC